MNQDQLRAQLRAAHERYARLKSDANASTAFWEGRIREAKKALALLSSQEGTEQTRLAYQEYAKICLDNGLSLDEAYHLTFNDTPYESKNTAAELAAVIMAESTK